MASLIRELYQLRQAGKITDAEAQWVLRVVLGPDGYARLAEQLKCLR